MALYARLKELNKLTVRKLTAFHGDALPSVLNGSHTPSPSDLSLVLAISWQSCMASLHP